MRTVIYVKWDGLTENQYEKIRKSSNWDRNIPKGMVFHVAAFNNNGIEVTDIWESADDYKDFVINCVIPAAKEAGIKGVPQVEMFPVHSVFVPILERAR